MPNTKTGMPGSVDYTRETPLEEIVKAAKRGDKEAANELVIRFEKYVCAIARRILRDPELVKDAAQEAWMKIFRELHKFDPRQAQFQTFLLTITRSVCLDLYRRRKRKDDREDPIDEAATCPDEAKVEERAILVQMIAKAMQALTPEEVKIAEWLETGLSYKEIANALGTTEGDVAVKVCRLRKKIKPIYNEYIKRQTSGVSYAYHLSRSKKNRVAIY